MVSFIPRSRVADPGRKLRELIEARDILVAPGVFNPAVALLAERMGFEALYLSGAALTGSLAMPDLGVITLSEVSLATRYIARAVDSPLIVDANTGYGEAVNVVRTVIELEEAGAAGIQIEDQVLPKKCGHLSGIQLVPPEDMAKKIRAAATARSRGTLIIARTDSRSVEGLDEAIDRARLYVRAGADVIFPEALRSVEEFREFSRKVDAPILANMTEFGKTPLITVEEFRRAGVKIVIFPVTLFRVSMEAARRALRVIKEKGTQKPLLGEMMTRQEFYSLIGYDEYVERDLEISRAIESLVKGAGT